MNNKHYLLALNRIPAIGPRTVAKLLKRWPNLEELFQLSQINLEQLGIPLKIAESIANFNLNEVDDDWRWQEADGHFLLTWCDAEYPSLLKEIPDPPPVLFAKGDLSCFLFPAIAIVGSRKPSIAGKENAWHFAHELALNQLNIVSGLALGVDAQAHSGCLHAQGKTTAVMGTGIDFIYPARHRVLAEKICENGLLLSEFPLRSPPIAGHFPRRNRIISGLSLATLVVEAAIRSGSLITARLALEQNRDVFAIPGSIHNPQAQGCHHLLQQGAKLVTSCDDVLSELQLTRTHYTQNETGLALASENKNLVKCIGFEVTSIDQIIDRTGLSVENVTCGLAELELLGMIKAVSGGYMRCML